MGCEKDGEERGSKDHTLVKCSICYVSSMRRKIRNEAEFGLPKGEKEILSTGRGAAHRQALLTGRKAAPTSELDAVGMRGVVSAKD